jgi:hypothetical protein
MREKQPQMRFSAHARLKLATSGPSSRDMSSALVSIDTPYAFDQQVRNCPGWFAAWCARLAVAGLGLLGA